MPSILIICIISALLCTDRTVAFLDDGAACLKGKWHSETPIKHQNLTGECSIYSNYSCCTDELSRNLSTQGFEIAYGFDLNHCRNVKNISQKCYRHFMDDLCAYECNPYYHPWIIKDDKYWREERFHKVPLCWTSCLSWYDDCKDDYTCSDNWLQGFNWIDVDGKKKNVCPSSSECRSISTVFHNNASEFCENIWNDTYKIVSDDFCFTLSFNESIEYPAHSFAVYLNYRNEQPMKFPLFVIIIIMSIFATMFLVLLLLFK